MTHTLGFSIRLGIRPSGWAKFAFSGVVGILLAGCQSMPLQQSVAIATNPAGAIAQSTDTSSCVTPCSLKLDRSRDHVMTLSKAGYETQTVMIYRRYRTAEVWMGALNSGLNSVGDTPDASKIINRSLRSVQDQQQSGAAYDLYPSVISVMLTPVDNVPR